MATQMPMQKLVDSNQNIDNPAFLTVPELAQLLHVNEKKIYQLAGCGEIPGTKVTGKWIFPRQLIDDWLLENSHGGVMHDRLLIGGSDDRLVHQICNHAAIEWQQHALVSYSPAGTRHGLRMLDSGRIDACFINWGETETNALRHLGLIRSYRNHHSWVIVRCLERSQGLIMRKELEDRLKMKTDMSLEKLLNDRQLCWAMRQTDSGCERLLADLCSTCNLSLSSLQISNHCNSERCAVAAINSGQADLTCGVKCAASESGLAYHELARVSLDLVMSRKTYFRTLMQEFIERIQNADAVQMAKSLGGYQIRPSARLLTVN